MLYNIAIDTPGLSLKIILAIDETELQRFLEAYESGKEHVVISGEKLRIANPERVKIYNITKYEKASRNEIVKEINKYAFIMSGGLVTLETLREHGEDITSQYITGEWGQKKEKRNAGSDPVVKNGIEQTDSRIMFFTEQDFKVLVNYAGSKKIAENSDHTKDYEYLAQVYRKVEYWARQVQQQLFPNGETKLIRRPTNQANYFDHFLWAKIYPQKNGNLELAFTVEINSDELFVLKIDTVGLDDYDEKRLKYLDYRGSSWDFSRIVKMLNYKDVIKYDWDYLIAETVTYFKSIVGHYNILSGVLGIKKENDPPVVIPEIPKVNHWLMSYNPRSWPVKFYLNESYWFHDEYTAESLDFIDKNLKEAKIGDYIFGYSNFPESKSYIIFQLTKELSYSEKHMGNVIVFRPVYISEEGIFSHEITSNKNIQGEFSNYKFEIGFYKLNETSFAEILKLFRISYANLNEAKEDTTLAMIANDIDHDAVSDKLDFETDIEALASLISYKKIAPPLAIGLFGNWGTGKSYFIHHLAKKIQNYSLKEDEAFCRNTIEVHFNSWHYIDSNLWASLVNHIFGSINKYFQKIAGKGEKGEKESQNLYSQLNSTQKRIVEKEHEKSIVNKKITELSGELGRIIQKKEQKINKLHIPAADIFKNLKEVPGIKEKIKKIEEITVGPALNDITIVGDQLKYLQNFWVRLVQAFRNLKTYSPKEWFFYVVLPLFLFVAPWLIPFVIDVPLLQQILSTVTSKLLFVLGSVIVFLIPVNKLLGKFEVLHSKLQELKAEKLKQKIEKEKEAEKIRDEFKVKEKIINIELAQLVAEKSKIEADIIDIKSGKRLYDWISEKASKDDYKKHLGLISTIREDFEMLDALMLDQKKAEELSISKSGVNSPNVKIDRIVLFIDDLDRCPEDRVVEVLQAVHLLMAFKLFVVVVGVDSRWLKNSIENKYTKEMEGGDASNPKANANDYLEKIFQVTFKLRSMNVDSAANYINFLTKRSDENTEGVVKEGNKPETEKEKEVYDPLKKELPKDEPLKEKPDVPPVVIPERKITSKQLEFSDLEREYMVLVSSIVSASPRTLKRFVNMYRIIRIHENFRKLISDEKNNETAMLLLALMVSGKLKNDWLGEILLANENLLFKDLKFMPVKVKEMKLQVLDYKVVNFKPIALLVNRFGYN